MYFSLYHRIFRFAFPGPCRRLHSSVDMNAHKRAFPSPLQAEPSPHVVNFQKLGLHPLVLSALDATEKKTPTSIQKSAIPVLLSSRHALIAAETGSGKTLSYLIPLLSALKTREKASQTSKTSGSSYDTDYESLLSPPLMRPTILILQPTRELADQVLRVAKELSHVAKFRVRGALGGGRRQEYDHRLSTAPVDMLIGTPGAVQRLFKARKLFLSHVRAVVLDEADELLEAQHNYVNEKREFANEPGQLFTEQIRPLLSTFKRKNVQHVYVAATVPANMERWLHQHHGDKGLTVVRGDRLHRVVDSATLKTSFIRLDGSDGVNDAKFRKVVEVIKMALSRKDTGKILVFCDGHERRECVVDLLSTRGVRVVHLGGSGVSPLERDKNWAAFRDNKIHVAVCARSFARGIDDTEIRTVILMDVPYTGTEYLHRIGRIRNGGRVYVLVGSKERVIAEELFLSHVNGEKIAGVDAKTSWSAFTSAGYDRMEHNRTVRTARKNRTARWVDERASKIGTFRGRQGRNAKKIEGNIQESVKVNKSRRGSPMR